MHRMILFISESVFTFSFMTQSINVRHVLNAVFVPVSLHSHASSVPVFNGLNFPD